MVDRNAIAVGHIVSKDAIVGVAHINDRVNSHRSNHTRVRSHAAFLFVIGIVRMGLYIFSPYTYPSGLRV